MSSTEHNHAHGGISNESSPKNKKLEMLRRGNKRRHSFSEHQIKQLVLPKDQKQQTTDSTNSSPGESPNNSSSAYEEISDYHGHFRRRHSMVSLHSWQCYEDAIVGNITFLRTLPKRSVFKSKRKTSLASSITPPSLPIGAPLGRRGSNGDNDESDPLFADFVKLLKKNDVNIPGLAREIDQQHKRLYSVIRSGELYCKTPSGLSKKMHVVLLPDALVIFESMKEFVAEKALETIYLENSLIKKKTGTFTKSKFYIFTVDGGTNTGRARSGTLDTSAHPFKDSAPSSTTTTTTTSSSRNSITASAPLTASEQSSSNSNSKLSSKHKFSFTASSVKELDEWIVDIKHVTSSISLREVQSNVPDPLKQFQLIINSSDQSFEPTSDRGLLVVSDASAVPTSPAGTIRSPKQAAPTSRVMKLQHLPVLFTQDNTVKSAAFTELLELLFDPEYNSKDKTFMRQFFVTYRYFMKLEDLLEFIEKKHQSRMVSVSRLREVLIALMGIFHTMTQQQRQQLRSWLVTLDEKELAIEVIAEMDKMKEKEDSTKSKPRKRTSSFRLLTLKRSNRSDFLDFGASELAEQLTIMEHNLFMKIDTKEFFDQAWTKKNAVELAPKISQYIEHFNRITYWVGTEILFASTLSQRVATIRRWIHAAKKCYGMNSFNTAFEIIAGLQMAFVSRLFNTWSLLAKKDINVFERLAQIFSPENNYMHYREVVKNKKEPLNPYLALVLRDLTIMEMHNETYSGDHVNFEKLRLIGDLLLHVKKIQSVAYDNLAADQQIQLYLSEIKVLPEQELWLRSKRAEAGAGGPNLR